MLFHFAITNKANQSRKILIIYVSTERKKSEYPVLLVKC